MKRVGNEEFRRQWLQATLAAVPSGSKLLDVGAGECQYKAFCSHLDYVSQDFNIYTGASNNSGLHMEKWDTSQIDIVCDLLDIPETTQYDVVLCTEVLEHVPDPVRALEKISRLVKEGGSMIITAPFCSLTHFAPFHYATGLSRYFYQHHLDRLGFAIEEMRPNGGFFDYLDQELSRTSSVKKQYAHNRLSPLERLIIKLAGRTMRKIASRDGPREERASADLLTFGWHVRARSVRN